MAPRNSPRRFGEPWQFQAVPRWIYLLAGVGALFILLPLFGMVAQVDWAAFIPLISSESSIAALGLSLRTATASTLLCIIFGIPLALVLARARFRGQGVLRALILLPLVVPPVVGGLALLYTFGRVAWIGQTFSTFGIDIAFSTTAVVMAQAFVALPFLVLSLEGSLRTAGQKYEAVAATLGARPSTVLRRITLPLVLPGLVSGAVLAFARSLGEFGATLTFAGSLQGVTRTLPLEIYLQRETDPDAAVALSFLLIAVSLVVVLLAYRTPRSPLRVLVRGSAPPQDVLP
ncbi:ABC transporter permease [Arthrobacter sp. N199823]|uniref:ABC transporter permease n=1 Tax=Arthrobacter sp. N199823 TaxID=2058895 RepID=UPI0021580C1A|nr:ABC transporter permease [Arthrobacter sp. N199823]